MGNAILRKCERLASFVLLASDQAVIKLPYVFFSLRVATANQFSLSFFFF